MITKHQINGFNFFDSQKRLTDKNMYMQTDYCYI